VRYLRRRLSCTQREAESRMSAMTAAMRHQVPTKKAFLTGRSDAEDLHWNAPLSISDLDGGHQPAGNETKDVASLQR